VADGRSPSAASSWGIEKASQPAPESREMPGSADRPFLAGVPVAADRRPERTGSRVELARSRSDALGALDARSGGRRLPAQGARRIAALIAVVVSDDRPTASARAGGGGRGRRCAAAGGALIHKEPYPADDGSRQRLKATAQGNGSTQRLNAAGSNAARMPHGH